MYFSNDVVSKILPHANEDTKNSSWSRMLLPNDPKTDQIRRDEGRPSGEIHAAAGRNGKRPPIFFQQHLSWYHKQTNKTIFLNLSVFEASSLCCCYRRRSLWG